MNLDVLAHAPEGELPPPLSPITLVTEAQIFYWLTAVLLVVAGLYLYGVHRLRQRGDHWPVQRTVAFLGAGLGSLAAVTVGGLGAYDTVLLSAHMVQHMVLSMVAPIFLALGAPVTLALRVLPRRPRRLLLRVLHSPVARFYTFPLVAFANFVVTPFVLYFTGLYRLSLENELFHEFVHVHFLVAGCLFFWPLVGLDPLPNRWPHAGRVLLMVAMVPFHTVLGLVIMQAKELLGGDWYPSLGLTWADPYADQHLAGGILWASGEFISVVVLGVVAMQWLRASEREARRVDRELDRLEAAQAADAATSPRGAVTPDGSGPTG
ncbi:MAG TPA: cytochrome c oxidase assembly protein [Natronosporangium sp.]|nr:cytochrome c oxidase assembly protein [Natronosporangium sp.]